MESCEQPEFCQPTHATKMKMRNLRAKVKLLLPNSGCNHYRQRNSRIEKMQPKREKTIERIRDTYLKDQWVTAKGNQQPWFFQHFEPQYIFSQFSKLSKSELQQISDNKNYFLPEKYIEAFKKYNLQEDFLKQQKNNNNKHKSKHLKHQTTIPITIISNTVRISDHITKHNQKQRLASQRYQIIQQMNKNRSMQKQNLIQSRLLKAMHLRNSLKSTKSSFQKNKNRLFNVKNNQQLQQLRSQRSQIIKITTQLKRICTFRKRKTQDDIY